MSNKRSISESNDQESGSKRSKIDIIDLTDDVAQENCPYGEKCYRKNPDHFKHFSHPHQLEIRNQSEVLESKSFYYLTKVAGLPQANNPKYSIGISEILSLNADEFIQSAQFNYCVDIQWLIDQYPDKNQDKPLHIIHGSEGPGEVELKKDASPYPQIKLIRAKLTIPYGTHHTKMMFLLYKNGLRVVIHTANLIHQDWHQKTQGVWISELFPKCDISSKDKNDSKTNFKSDLINYVDNYKESGLKEWIEILKTHDMSSANVFLIPSYPGRFMASKNMVGYLRLRSILTEYLDTEDESDTSIISQFSSIGSLGPNESSWLFKELYAALNASKKSDIKNLTKLENVEKILIYPSVENVRTSLEGYMGGTSLPYSEKVADRQKYLDKLLYVWKSDKLKRTSAVPHIKTYCRFSNNYSKLYWFLLTSANLSKAAWGVYEKGNTQFMIRSYELGVLFLPSFVLNSKKNYFSVNDEFTVPYDLPPVKYSVNDKPWVYDKSYTDKEDSHERIWRIK